MGIYQLGTLKGGLYRPHMGGCQNYGPLLGTRNIRGRTIIGIKKRDHNLTTTHITPLPSIWGYPPGNYPPGGPLDRSQCLSDASLEAPPEPKHAVWDEGIGFRV